MAIAFVDISPGISEWYAATKDVAVPTHSEGDLLLLTVETVAPGIAAPSGWTEHINHEQDVNTDEIVQVLWKIASDSEPATYTLTKGSLNHFSAAIASFSGVDTDTPFHTYTLGGSPGSAGGVTPMPFPAITTTIDNCMLVFVAAIADNTSLSVWTAPGTDTFTNALYYSHTQGSDGTLAVGYGPLATAGTVAASGVTTTNPEYGSTTVIALQVAGGGGGGGAAGSMLVLGAG